MSNTARSDGGLVVNTRWGRPSTSVSVISNGPPGPVMAATASS